jgi:pimeloyl-ACP methyl ester carboxylesterase
MLCTGAGAPPVLLESGIAASSVMWTAVQPQVATFTRVCAYDRAGFAWSDPPSCPRTFQRIVDELEIVLDDAGIREPTVLVGHSLGSLIVRAFAARHPERTAGLVLIDPPTEWLTPTPARARLLRGGRVLSRVGGILAHLGLVRAGLALLSRGRPRGPRQFVKVFGPAAAAKLHHLVQEVRKLPRETYPVVEALWCQPKCFTAMAEHMATLQREGRDMHAAVPRPTIPVVVISGGDQPPERLGEHKALADTSSRGRHIVAARSAHWIPFDEPELLVQLVRELVESARNRPVG